MNSFNKICNSVLAILCCILILANLAVYGASLFARDLEILETITNIIGFISLPVAICEIVFFSVFKPKGKEVTHNVILFTALCILSLGVFFKGLFFFKGK